MIFSTVADKRQWKPEHIWWPLPTDQTEKEKGKPLTQEEIKKHLARFN